MGGSSSPSILTQLDSLSQVGSSSPSILTQLDSLGQVGSSPPSILTQLDSLSQVGSSSQSILTQLDSLSQVGSSLPSILKNLKPFHRGLPLQDVVQIFNLLHIRCSIVVSISACHTEDPGSIPGGGPHPACAQTAEV